MNYKIEITKVEPNPNYAEELKKYNRQEVFNQRYDDQPIKEKVINVLACELSEEEYKKVKAEVLKVFE